MNEFKAYKTLMSRPVVKDNPVRVALTLGAKSRAYLVEKSQEQGVSRTQIVEYLIEADVAKEKTVVFSPAAAALLGTKARGKKSSG